MASVISVLIPTYNRADVLQKTLEDMCALEISEGFAEIIIVDNNSNDNTKNIIESFCDRLPVRYCFESKQGQNAARVKAVELAQGELFVFTDDDVTPTKDWLKKYAVAAEKWPDSYVFGGPVITIPPEGIDPIIVKAAEVLGLGHLELDIQEGFMPEGINPLSANFMLRKTAFQRFGLIIDASIGPKGNSRISGSETSIFRQLSAAGQKTVYLPHAPITHRTDKEFWSLPTLKRRAFGQGRGRARFAPVESNCSRLFGVPRFLYRAVLSLLIEELWHMLSGNHLKKFQTQLRRKRCWGTIYECYLMSKHDLKQE